MSATLFRQHGPAWRFEYDDATGYLLHTTVRGTRYRLWSNASDEQPMKILTFRTDEWVNVATILGAQFLQFDNGNEFWFIRRPSE